MFKRIFLIVLLVIVIFPVFSLENKPKPVSFELGFQLVSGIPETDYIKWGFGDNYQNAKKTAWLYFLRCGIYCDLLFNINKNISLGPEFGLYYFSARVEDEFYLFFDIPVNVIFRININNFFLASYGGLYLMNWDLREWMRLYNIGGRIGFLLPKRNLRLYLDGAYILGDYHMIRVALGLSVQLR